MTMLLMAVDVQDTWLETTVWGFGRGEEMWRIWHQKVEGSPAYEEVWQQIDSIRKTQFPREGGGSEFRIVIPLCEATTEKEAPVGA